jgi:tripartite-type tricarboxylate transporter receptor subunit TctC
MKKIVALLLAAVLVSAAFAFTSCVPRERADDGGEWRWARRVTLISPWGPGGGLGPVLRTIAPLAQGIIGVPIEIQHVEGGGGSNGTVFTQRQPADGFTFMAGTQSQVALDIQGQLPFKFRDEFVPVGKLVHSVKGILVSRRATEGMFAPDFESFLAYVRANPRTLSVGMRSAGGSDEASLIETLALAYGLPMSQVHDFLRVIPYTSGSEMDAAMVGGHIHATVQGLNESPGIIESGDVIPLVVLAERRLKAFPDVPATGQDFNIASYIGTWRGIFARRGTPQAAIDAMDAALMEAWHMEAFQLFCEVEGYLERTGYEGQEGFRALIDAEYKTMEEFLRAAGKIR